MASSSSASLDARVLIADKSRLAAVQKAKPWMTDVKYFKRVQINAVATLKMARFRIALVQSLLFPRFARALRCPFVYAAGKLLADGALQTSHAASGVEKGLRSANAMPIEVMGFLHGHISTDEPGVYVITDAFPLPVEGTETTVVSDSPEVQKYMVDLNDALEKVCMIRSSELPNS